MMDFDTWVNSENSHEGYYEDLSTRPAPERKDWLATDVKRAVSDYSRMVRLADRDEDEEFCLEMATRRIAHLGIPRAVAHTGDLDKVRAYIVERDHDDALTDDARRERAALVAELTETEPEQADEPEDTAETAQPAQCAAITRRGTQCLRRGHHDGLCWQHGRIRDASAQESDVATVTDLASEYGMTVQAVAVAIGDASLTEHDGVDGATARGILSRAIRATARH